MKHLRIAVAAAGQGTRVWLDGTEVMGLASLILHVDTEGARLTLHYAAVVGEVEGTIVGQVPEIWDPGEMRPDPSQG